MVGKKSKSERGREGEYWEHNLPQVLIRQTISDEYPTQVVV